MAAFTFPKLPHMFRKCKNALLFNYYIKGKEVFLYIALDFDFC